jgi:hypothetical protein
MAGKQRPSSLRQVSLPLTLSLPLTFVALIMTGSIAGSIGLSQLTAVLENWIIPLDLVSLQQGVPLNSLQKLIQRGLERLKCEQRAELSCEEFISLCQFILASCQQQ